jgi:hypothetical protein
LAIARMKPVQQMPPDRIGKRLEDLVHAHDNMQPKGYILCQAINSQIFDWIHRGRSRKGDNEQKAPRQGGAF